MVGAGAAGVEVVGVAQGGGAVVAVLVIEHRIGVAANHVDVTSHHRDLSLEENGLSVANLTLR